jgi:gliding motility-associated-like protein
MQFDPAAPVSATNPAVNTIPLPPGGAGGLAVSTNLNGPGPSPTFYLVGGSTGTYMYWDGTTWVNTGHTWSAVNPCGAGSYIYTLNGGSGQVYRYDGSGNDVLVTTISSFASGGPYDLAGDNCGNFYVLRMNNAPYSPYLNKYDPAGNLLASYTVTGGAAINSGGGMGIIGNTIYCHNLAGLWIGTIASGNVSFTLLPGAPAISPADFGTCALGSLPSAPKASIDTAYYCGTGPAIPISLLGGTPLSINWSVISGTATITGSGGNITVMPASDARILMDATVIDPCGASGIIAGKDTVTIILPTAILEAGHNFTTYGCGNYIDTINATLTNHKTWMQYNIAWTPASNIQAGITALTPVINPQADTWFKVTAATKASQGGCTWSDSVHVTLVDATVEGVFGHKINFGCTEDTVLLIDSSTSALGTLKYHWVWGDNSAADSTEAPVHIYENQNFYQIVQYTYNGHCRDTLFKFIDLNHPLVARFDFTDGRICQGDAINFTGSNSIISLPRTPAKWWWFFGDGVTDTVADPVHAYPDSRVYSPTLVVFDSIGCSDTISHTIDNIIPPPYIDLGPSDTVICNGEPLHLPVGISARGDKWVWNDGSEQPKKVVTKNGTYIVRLYNECGFGADTISVLVKDCTIFFPGAFSPNGDGKNDLARIIGNTFDVTTCEMTIFNRWGTRVYYTMSKEGGWDGTYKGELQPTDTYYYYVKYTTHGQDYEMKGNIILVR